MSRLARKDTAPELALRRELHGRGLRYFVHRRPLPGLRREADVIFPRARVAVFVDGCFWHGCERHGRRGHYTNGWYWPKKVESNRLRDLDTNARLASAGWMAIRIWEHDRPESAAEHVANVVRRRRQTPERAER